MHRTLLLCVGAACLAAPVASAPVLGRAAGLRGERAADAALSGRDHIGSLLEKLDLPPLMNCEYGDGLCDGHALYFPDAAISVTDETGAFDWLNVTGYLPPTPPPTPPPTLPLDDGSVLASDKARDVNFHVRLGAAWPLRTMLLHTRQHFGLLPELATASLCRSGQWDAMSVSGAWAHQTRMLHQVGRVRCSGMMSYEVQMLTTPAFELTPRFPVKPLGIPYYSLREGDAGPEDVRQFVINGTLYASFVMLTLAHDTGRHVRAQHVMNMVTGAIVQLRVPPAELQLAAEEKNWVPLVQRGVLHFIYSFDPLLVLECADVASGVCRVCHSGGLELPVRLPLAARARALHGGSAAIAWDADDAYHVALVRVDHGAPHARSASMHWVVVSTQPWAVIFLSERIDPSLRIWQGVLAGTALDVASRASTVTPSGLLLSRSRRAAVVWCHYADMVPFAFMLDGLHDAMQRIIALHARTPTASWRAGELEASVGALASMQPLSLAAQVLPIPVHAPSWQLPALVGGALAAFVLLALVLFSVRHPAAVRRAQLRLRWLLSRRPRCCPPKQRASRFIV